MPETTWTRETAVVSTSTTLDTTVSGALTVSGLLTATSGIKLGNNNIISSGAVTAITVSDTATTILGDLTVTGNDISSSSGVAMTLSGTDVTVLGDLTVTGGDIFGTAGGDLNIKSNGNLAFYLDFDTGESGQKFYFYNHTATEIATLDESGDLQIDGDLTVTGNDIKSSTATTITLAGASAIIAGDLTANGGNISLIAGNDTDTGLRFAADEGTDAGDEWEIKTKHSDQKFVIGNDIASAGTFVSHLEITPNATVASSLVTIAGDLTVTGNTLTFGNAETINNDVNGTLELTAATVKIDGNAEVEGGDSGPALLTLTSISDQHSQIQFTEVSSAKWYMANNTTGDIFTIGTGSTVGSSLALAMNGKFNVGVGTGTFDSNSISYLAIGNGTSPTAHTDNQIYIGSRDSLGSGTDTLATLALFCEEGVDPTALDAVGTLTTRIPIWVNNVCYWLYLDPA